MDFNELQNNSSNQVSDKLDHLDKNIDIFVKQRRGRKCTTTIHGLNFTKEELKKYAKDLRKLLGCACSLDTEDENDDIFLKLSGKDTSKICEYLIKNLEIKKENIIIHGG
jgi:translation initiation factor SUI1